MQRELRRAQSDLGKLDPAPYFKDTQPSANDPVLQAMRSELERSKSALKLEGLAAPYYID
jgi:hypothetical protein